MRTQALLLSLFLFLLSPNFLKADLPVLPLPAGADAPNFTLTDLDGVSHTLYDYLDAGKTVMIEFSATWCGPCWNYHNTHILNDLYTLYGPNGTNEIMVFFIEADPGTPVSALYGGPGSQGNWTLGTDFPIMDDGTGAVSNSFSITFYPTLYAICPNRKTYVVGQAPLAGWENWINSCSLAEMSALDNASCFDVNDGSIDLTVSGGMTPVTYHWNTGAGSQDLSNLAPGTYSCTITEGQGHTVEAGPFTVSSPPELTIASSNVIDVACFGDANGFINVQAGGGSPGYSYAWNTGASGSTLTNISAGNYSVLITDGNGCTESESFTVQQPSPLVSSAIVNNENCGNGDGVIILQPQGGTFPYTYDYGNGPTGAPIANNLAAGTYPVSVIDAHACEFIMMVTVEEDPPPHSDAGPSSQIDCTNNEVILDGTASESGASIAYQWTTTDGMIVNGGSTTTPTVGAAGTYVLEVTDLATGCVGSSQVVVSEDVAIPVSDAGVDEEIDCANSTVLLDGSGSSQGANYVYFWSTLDGNIISGETTLNPACDAPGTYVLYVTNTLNGCESTSEALVIDSQNEPIADAGVDAELTCVVSELTLDGSGSESGSNISYDWSTVTGNIVSGASSLNPIVDAPGIYEIEVTDQNTGCVSTATVEVADNQAIPMASAIPTETLDCNNLEVFLDGTASEAGPNISYLWTTPTGNIISGSDSATPLVNEPGTYILAVVNTSNGCSSDAEVIVDLVLPVEATIDSQTDLLCANDNDGAATIVASLGSSPYSYSWSSGGTEATETGLAEGLYTVSVTDADNCEAIVEIEILAPDLLLANAQATNETSAGANDGTATAFPEGGTGTYDYFWSTGEMTASISGLTPGSYDVEITDSNGCTTMQSVTVGEFNCTISASAEGTDVSCFGGADGTAQLDLTNASEPYQIAWSSGGTEATETGLAAGIYTVNILDDNNCPTTTSVTITEPAELILGVEATQDASCFGEADGTAQVSGSGGVGGFSYVWPSGNMEATETGLVAGTYLVSVSDGNGCQTEVEVEIGEPFILLADAVTIEESANEANDASIELLPFGGTDPYTYLWNTGDTEAIIENLGPGTYDVEITDANGCTYIESYTIDPFDCGIIDVSSLSESTSCNGGDDGIAMVDIAGGDGPYTYEWFDGSDGTSVENLPAGEYAVTVIDANNCPVDGIAIIEQPDPLTMMVTDQSNIECPGQTSGAATVDASGGTAGYTYLWQDDQTGPTATNLPVGEIMVQVTDANNCTEVISVEIIEGIDETNPTIVAESAVVLSLNNLGQATLTIGMVDLGTFDNCTLESLALSQVDFDCSMTGIQNVILTALDESGNMSTEVIEVEIIDMLPPMIQCPTPILTSNCAEPIFYEPFATDNCGADVNLIEGLESGSVFPEGETTITLEAVDGFGNAASCSFTVTVENTLEGSVETSGSCVGETEGSAVVDITGGLPGYNYEWSTGDMGPMLDGVAGGEYEVIVTDAAGCVTSLFATVEEFAQPAYEIVSVVHEDNGNGQGAIDVTITNGEGPYIYSWTDVEGNQVGDDEDLGGLSAGIYILEVIDVNGCTIVSEPIIIENAVNTISVFNASELDVFPNPTTDFCQVQLALTENHAAFLTLFDVTGRMVHQQASEQTDAHYWELQLNEFAAGLYLIRIEVNGEAVSRKLIVE